jgi:hypothetical protein
MRSIIVTPKPGPGYIIREKGVHNLKKILAEVKSWSDDNQYDFYEKSRKNKPKGIGHKLELKWLLERKITEFIRFNIEINYVVLDLVPTGEDLVSGSLEVTIEAEVIIDYQDQWAGSKFKNFLLDLYENIFYKGTIDRYKDKLDAEVKELRDVIKDILEFHK